MIRRASKADADRIAEIWLDRPKPHEHDPMRAQMIREAVARLEHPFGYWVYEVDGLVIGWASLSPMRANPAVSPSMAELSCYLSRERRSNGGGSSLVKAVTEAASSSSLEYIVGWCAHSNGAAIRIFEHLQFDSIAEFPAPSKNTGRGDVLLYRLGV